MKTKKNKLSAFIQHHFSKRWRLCPLGLKSGAGFTLIEVIIVVTVIALLAILGIVYFRNELYKGNDARRKADLKRIAIAVEEYEKDHNCYPKVEEMKLCGTDPSIAIHPYLNNVPCDPITHEPYLYEPSGPTSCSWYRLYTTLQNTGDSSAIYGIGPSGVSNYYVRSPNAPIFTPNPTATPIPSTPTPMPSTPISTPTPSPSPFGGGNDYWAIVNGSCQKIGVVSGGRPNCTPAYTDSNCTNAPLPLTDCAQVSQ